MEVVGETAEGVVVVMMAVVTEVAVTAAVEVGEMAVVGVVVAEVGGVKEGVAKEVLVGMGVVGRVVMMQ